MKSQPGPVMPGDGPLTPQGGANATRKASGTGTSPSPHKAGHDVRAVNAGSCGVCQRPLPPGAGAKYCSSTCRQMSYWLAQIQKALHDGLAEGIRPRLVELGRKSS